MTDNRSSREVTSAQDADIAAADVAISFIGDNADQRAWQIAEQLPNDVLKGMGEYTPLQVQLLHNRHIRGSNSVRAFFQADWHASDPPLHDLDRANMRIKHAIEHNEHIVVFGDYDCDGLTSCALLAVTLKSLGADIEPYVPLREDDGRGLNMDAVRDLATRGATLIVTTDCGSANVEEIELARALGIDVIVTDHHPPHGALPQAYAIVNPRHVDDLSHNKDLAGVGVAFRVAERLLQTSLPDEAATNTLNCLLDLVSVGTIGDVVPLSPENWALAHTGLRQLNHAPRAGLLALIHSAKQHLGEISARDISFSIAPRLNAAGRLGQPLLAVKLLMSDDPAEAETIAAQLEMLNIERQATTDVVLVQARHQVSEQRLPVLIAQGSDWPYGVLGLVAGRLSEEHHLPAFVISCANGECRGSGRAPQGMNLGSVLAARPDFFRRFGGHAQAVGFTLATEELAGFLAYIQGHFSALHSSQSTFQTEHSNAPFAGEAEQAAQPGQLEQSNSAGEANIWTHNVPLNIDCRLPLRRVVPEVAEALARLAPFGQEFEEPVFVCSGVRIIRCWPSGAEGRNLRLVLREGDVERVALWPRQGSRCNELRRQLPQFPPLDIAYTIQSYRNRYTDTIEIVPRIVALRAALSRS